MSETQASLKEWQKLYEAAIEFRKLEPWKWMHETDIFGVQNPETGEIGYCCIMGELGEMLAMAVYRGTEGLNGYKKIQSGHIDTEDPDSLFVQDCIMLSFENKKFVHEDDREIINELGLKFRGKNAWPVFRSYRPGYFPWFLNRNEIIYMTFVINQAIIVCLRIKDNWRILLAPKKGLYLVRAPEMRNGVLTWKDSWMFPMPVEARKEESVFNIDENKIKEIKNKLSFSTNIWEIDFFYSPVPISQGEQPFFPYSLMVIDHDSGLINFMHIAEPFKYHNEFVDKFIEFLETNGIIPLEILVRKEEVKKFLEPFASILNIKLTLKKKLYNVEHARKELFKFLKGKSA